jgi:AcrR family transcriptional regulator
LTRSSTVSSTSKKSSNNSIVRPCRPYHHGDLRRTLIDAGLALVTEEQDWTFSLREVARRAGVSHNAPYNHFGDKQDLLIAIAGAGFERLRQRMVASVAGIAAADEALLACGRAYIESALENAALYRLMFGPALAKSKGGRPRAAREAGDEAKAVLVDIIVRGARSLRSLQISTDKSSQGEHGFAAHSHGRFGMSRRDG